MKKRVVSVLLAAVMVMGMAIGCGSGNSGDTASNTQDDSSDESGESSETGESTDDTDSAEEVTLSVLAGQSTTDAGIEEFIDEALAEQYPEITLEWECVDWGNDFQPKMQQYMQSGLPDIMIGKAQDVATYAPKGLLGEIDETYLDRGQDAARENVTVDGKTYSVMTARQRESHRLRAIW